MKVMIVGGTGLLGYHSALLFLERGHKVDTIALPDMELGKWFPGDKIDVKYGDIFTMSRKAIKELLKGYDAIVYAVGPDDRITPPAPAYEFFYERLVVSCSKIVECAREAGVKRCVVCNSYFAYFDRIWPHLNLSDRHPYIKCRVEQAEKCLGIGGSIMDVMILELPYIFGTMPGRAPLWKEVFLERFKKMKRVIYFFKGGTVMMTVEQVAQCILGAIEKGEGGRRYPCGSVNVDWDSWLSWIQEGLGSKKRVVHLPPFLGSLYGSLQMRKNRKEGLQSGLNHRYLFPDIQCRYLYYDDFQTNRDLEVSSDDLKLSVIRTMKACL